MARRTMSRRVASARAPKMRSKSMVLRNAICIDTTIWLYVSSCQVPSRRPSRKHQNHAIVIKPSDRGMEGHTHVIRWAKRVVEDRRFNAFIVSVILVNAVLVGLETSEDLL